MLQRQCACNALTFSTDGNGDEEFWTCSSCGAQVPADTQGPAGFGRLKGEVRNEGR